MAPLHPGLLKSLGLFAKDVGCDIVHSLQYWRHNLRGNRVRKNYLKRRSDYNPVILVQGFLGTRGVLLPLEKHLRALGHDVISINLGLFNVGDIRESAHFIGAKIERFLKNHGGDYHHRKVDIIGHSMGGLIALYYVKCLGGHARVEKLITLGAPFQGTYASYAGLIPFGLFSRGLWQMRPGSSLIESLQSHPEEVHRTEVTSISAKFDSICPPQACEIPWARNEVLPMGHASLLMDPRVFALTAEILETGRSAKIIPLMRPRRQR